MSQLLPVTQADHDAVQAFHRVMAARIMSDIASERPKLGEDEGDAGTLVQAFARHRIAASASPDIDHHQTNVMAPVEIGPVTPVEGIEQPDWFNAATCIENMQIAYNDALEADPFDDGNPIPTDTVVDAGDLGVLIGLARYALAASPANPAGSVKEADVERAAKALGLYRLPGGSTANNPPTRWPTDRNDRLAGRDGTVPLTWDFAKQCRAEARVMLAALHPVDSRAQGGEK